MWSWRSLWRNYFDWEGHIFAPTVKRKTCNERRFINTDKTITNYYIVNISRAFQKEYQIRRKKYQIPGVYH